MEKVTTDRHRTFCMLYIVRHGQTDWNTKGIVQGHLDSPLTEEGVRQAKAIGERFEGVSFDAVFSSDLARAVKTAEFAVLEKKLAVRTSQALRERRYGVFEGKHKDDFDAESRKLLIQFEALFKREKNGAFLDRYNVESDEEVAARVITLLREIAVAFGGKHVLVITHGGILRVLLTHLGFMKHEELGFGKIGNAGHVVVKSDGVDFFLEDIFGIA